MPTQSEVSTRFTADNSQYRSVVQDTIRVTDTGAKAILSKLNIRLGVGMILNALGIDMDKVGKMLARHILGFTEEVEEALKKTVEATAKAADEQERNLEQLRAKKKKQAEDDALRASEMAKREYELVRDARIKAKEEEAALDKKYRQEAADRQQNADQAHLQTVKDNLELLTLEAKAKRGLSQEEDTQLKLLRLKVKEQERIAELTTLLSLNKRSPEENARLQQLIKEKEVIELQVAAVKGVKEETAKIAPVIESNIDAWENFKSAINSTGRGNRELSDRELERKIGNIMQDISTRKAKTQFGGYDFMLGAQQSNLSQAIAERDLRERVRRDVTAFGADRAFAMNSGLTESRFAEITRGLSDSERVIKGLEELRLKQEKGLQAVVAALQAIQTPAA